MTIRIALFAILVLTLSGGCANSSHFEPTPIANSGNAMIYVYRPAASNPGKKPLTLSYPEVMINGKSAGMLRYNEHLVIEVAPGKTELLVTGLTPNAKWEPKDMAYTLDVKPGDSYYMRYGVEFDMSKMNIASFKGKYTIGFYPVEKSDAIYEIRHTTMAK
jgi:hypothetical protein